MLTSQCFFALHIDTQNHIHTRVCIYKNRILNVSFSVVGFSIGNLHMEPQPIHFLIEETSVTEVSLTVIQFLKKT